MSDQTKPASQRLAVESEWTVTDFGLVRLNGKDMVTALTYDQGKALVDAITAEREKVQILVDALEYLSTDGEDWVRTIANKSLAKVKEQV